ncbi:LysM domain-containing protein [Penicillium argentinense]|uniref:LysM domain-containing protein n=1 Tax=Penicillium argentinense TaxID=1131581 RepID=A0A9W9G130_9EURO|nr:LysM domain-containing protein [Penicillium argentinense]KAJ5110013.1 LysM domain-containing protein [Penicillium argentinense]
MPAAGKLSNSCNATFSTRVNCDPTILDVAYDGYFSTTDDLSSLCTSSCARSLNNLYHTQKSACTKGDTLSDSAYVYPATFTVETLLWMYNYTCRRDPKSGDFCAPIFDAWGDGKAENQTCSDCVLGTYQAQMNFPMGYDKDLANTFSSMTSFCSATNYPITSPEPATVSQSAKPTPALSSSAAARNCASTYTVKDGDDCHSISRSQSVSLTNMLYLNNLEAGCTHFSRAGTKLCMPQKCQVYTVKKDDSCYGIAEDHKNAFTMSQLVSWNVDINSGCDNLEMLVGHQISVSYPGDGGSKSSVTPVPSAPVPSFSCWDLNGHVPSSCIVTTYETLPPWVWPGYRTNSSSGISHASTSTPATSFSYYWTPLPSIYTMPPETTSSTIETNPTPLPHDSSMVSGCIDYWIMRGMK